MPDHDHPDNAAQEDSSESGQTTPRNTAGQLARYSEIAFLIPSAVFGGYLLGAAGKYFFGWNWAPLAGIILGAVAGFYQIIRVVIKLSKED